MTIGRKLPIAKYVAFLSLSVTQETTNPVTHKMYLIYYIFRIRSIAYSEIKI